MISLNYSPIPLFDYDSEDKNKRVVAWEVDPDGLTTALFNDGITVCAGVLQQLNFDVQIDSSNNFNTINLKTFNKSSCEEFQNGKLVKAYTINVPKETIDNDYDYYWRVKYNAVGITATTITNNIEGVTSFDITSNYCDGITFTIFKDDTIDIAKTLVDSLPDKNSYTKDEYSTKLYVIMRILADEFKLLNDEIKYDENSNYLKLCKEKYLSANFGNILNFQKSNEMTFAEYRQILLVLSDTYSNAGTKGQMKDVIKYLVGYKPDFVELKSLYGWLLQTPRDGSYEATQDYSNPAGRYFFFTSSYPNLNNSIRLFDENYKNFTSIINLRNIWRYKQNEISIDKIQETIEILKPAHIRISYNYFNYINAECFDRFYYGIDYYLYSYYMSQYSDLPGFFD